MVYSNQLLWGNWFVLLVGEGGELWQTTNPSIAHGDLVVLILMATFAYRNCNLFPVSCVCLALILAFTVGSLARTPLTQVICRDGSFLCPYTNLQLICFYPGLAFYVYLFCETLSMSYWRSLTPRICRCDLDQHCSDAHPRRAFINLNG